MKSTRDRVSARRPLPARPGLGLEAVHQVDHVVEAAPGAGADAGARDGDHKMSLAGAGAADQDDVALVGEEVAARQVADQGLVDRRAVEDEVVDVLGQRQLGDGDLVRHSPSGVPTDVKIA